MSEAELERTIVKIGVSTMPGSPLQAEGEVLKFDGFLKVYLESQDDDDEEDTKGILPPLKVGQILDLLDMTATERYTRPPARYTEAALVSKLEELGIGRPSTYAPTISKIMEENRGYVVKPTVFADVNNQMTIAQEEVFGPVLAIMPFETEEEAKIQRGDKNGRRGGGVKEPKGRGPGITC